MQGGRMMVPRQLWIFSSGLLLEVKFGNIAYLHVPDVITRWHSALAHLLDRAHVIYIHNILAHLYINFNYRLAVVIDDLTATQI